MKKGVIEAFIPLGIEIYGERGSLIISGRILGIPKERKSNLICFLEAGGEGPLSPVRYEWKEESGDFLVEFKLKEGLKGRLRVAVVSEAARG